MTFSLTKYVINEQLLQWLSIF